jgi:flavin reductase
MDLPPQPDGSAGPLKAEFLEAMSRGATMVNIVTTHGPRGRFGATVSAMASVSADMHPPTLLVCMNRGGSTAPAIIESGVFCLNILQESQRVIADTFADRIKTDSGDKFDCADWSRAPDGGWRLAGALASFDCRVLKADAVGSHYVIIGAAQQVAFRSQARALLYSARDYCAATPLAQASC